MADIKELKEILVAVDSLAVDVIKAAKDGIQITDLSVLIGNIGKITAAVDNSIKVGEEVSDLDRAEILELCAMAVNMVFNVVDALKAPKTDEAA